MVRKIGALVGKVIAAGIAEHVGPDFAELRLLASHAHDVVDGLASELCSALGTYASRRSPAERFSCDLSGWPTTIEKFCREDRPTALVRLLVREARRTA